MSKASFGKTGPVLFGCYIFSFLILFFFSLIFPSPDVMKYFYLDNAFKWALHYFIEFFIPINATAILLIYSLFIDTARLNYEKGALVRQLVSSLLVMFMILTVLYIICLLWIHPQIITGIKNNETKSKMSEDYYTLATSEVLKSENSTGEMKETYLRSAFLYIESCLKINPNYEEAKTLEKDIRQKIMDTGIRLTEEEITPAGKETKQNRDFIKEAGADDLLKKARELYDREKYFSAYYYAAMAYQLDNRLLDAYTLSEKAMEKIKSFDLSKKEEAIKDLSYNKKDWYRKIVSGEFLTVYYYFKELETRYPDDPDIKDYLQEIKEEFIDNYTFFYDEVKHIDYIPGIYNILFINYTDEKRTEFIYIHKMVNVIEGLFFKDMEVLTVSSTGEVISHLKAPFGKYVFVDPSSISIMQGSRPTKHHINTYCIRAYNKGISPVDYKYSTDTDISPEYIVKPPSGSRELPYIIPLYPDKTMLKNFQVGNISFDKTGLLELFFLSLDKNYEDAGFNRTKINREIISRFTLPFIFLFISLLSISIGWACRSRYLARPPVLTLIFIPFFPVVVAFLTRLYILSQRILFGFIVILLDLIPALIICIVFQSIAIIIALIVIAGKLTK
ncbi:MAG: hypothetical protein JXB88_11860 [Spirochaetales bacterium]|nr:hypothetical protein [Spirochaetales bacterium]